MGTTERVAEAIRVLQRHTSGRVIVVAIDGRSGAGKTTLAAALACTFGGSVVHGDDFYRDTPDAERRRLSPDQGVDRYFDWERLRGEALTPLARRERAQFRGFDWIAGHGLSTTVTVEPRDVVIVEGVYSARPEFDDLVDLKVLVEVADEERAQRRRQRSRMVSRDDPRAWDARWDAAERVYFDSIRPRSAFDLVVHGS